jgi:tRNA-2-methylthio-N6-dimethylallyladenosine synthase
MALVRAVGFAQAFSFRYSPRPGTPAALLESQVPEDVAMDRLYRLQALLEEQQRGFNRAMVGRTLPVLFEKPGRHPGQWIGRSPYLQGVHVTASPAVLGREIEVLITDSSLNSLAGVLAADAGRAA